VIIAGTITVKDMKAALRRYVSAEGYLRPCGRQGRAGNGISCANCGKRLSPKLGSRRMRRNPKTRALRAMKNRRDRARRRVVAALRCARPDRRGAENYHHKGDQS
jgi:hypothetical protein